LDKFRISLQRNEEKRATTIEVSFISLFESVFGFAEKLYPNREDITSLDIVRRKRGDAFMNDRESVLADIRYFTRLANVVMLLGFIFLALGIISESLNVTLGLEPIYWFLTAIFCMVGSINPKLHVVAGKHLLGIQTENKRE
jgi:hypothetical protein